MFVCMPVARRVNLLFVLIQWKPNTIESEVLHFSIEAFREVFVKGDNELIFL